MAIKIQDIIEKCNFLLDAEDSDRYTFDNDFKPAISLAQKWLISLYNKLFAENKISEESLNELHYVFAFYIGSNGKLTFNSRLWYWTAEIKAAVAAVDNGDGTVTIECVDYHYLPIGSYIEITQTTSYNGFYILLGDINGKNLVIAATYVAETFGSDKVQIVLNPWTITGIHPEIETYPTSPIGVNLDTSSFMGSVVSVKKILKSAKRLTIEEWAEKERNPILPGSSLITNTELKDYAYLSPVNYNLLSYPGDVGKSAYATTEIDISPSVASSFIGVSVLVFPGEINSVLELLPFPSALEEIVVEKVLSFLSIKEDDRRSLYDISEAEIQKAFTLLS